MSDLWIVIPRWRDFQHYKDRDPPWIKTYTRLLSDPNYLELNPHTTAVLHRLWLEYARSDCQLRASTAKLSRSLGVRVTKYHLETLNHAGFIRFSASRPLAPRARSRETETEKERTTYVEKLDQMAPVENSDEGTPFDFEQIKSLLKEMP